MTGPPSPVNEGPPAYTKLRIVDAAGGTARDVIRIPNANVIPLAWDRQAHLISAYESFELGAGAYDLVGEDGTRKVTVARPGLYVLAASPDGKHVLGHGDPNNVEATTTSPRSRGDRARQRLASSSTATGSSSGTRAARAAP